MARKSPLCLVLPLLLAGCGAGKSAPKALEQRLATEVPLHSTPAQVLAYLNAHKVAHSPYHHTDTAGMSIEAEMTAPAPHSLVQPTYDVVFSFDSHDLLKAYDVQYLGYVGL